MSMLSVDTGAATNLVSLRGVKPSSIIGPAESERTSSLAPKQFATVQQYLNKLIGILFKRLAYK